LIYDYSSLKLKKKLKQREDLIFDILVDDDLNYFYTIEDYKLNIWNLETLKLVK